MSSYQRMLVERTQIADGAIYSAKLGLSIQTGTGSPPAAVAYVAFPTAFGTPPEVTVFPGTQLAASSIGSGRFISITHVTKGSFVWRGTPLNRAQWRAVGFLDSQGN